MDCYNLIACCGILTWQLKLTCFIQFGMTLSLSGLENHQIFYNVVSASCMTKFYPSSCELMCVVICTGPGMIPAPEMIPTPGMIP